jgi:hypothetical protein
MRFEGLLIHHKMRWEKQWATFFRQFGMECQIIVDDHIIGLYLFLWCFSFYNQLFYAWLISLYSDIDDFICDCKIASFIFLIYRLCNRSTRTNEICSTCWWWGFWIFLVMIRFYGWWILWYKVVCFYRVEIDGFLGMVWFFWFSRWFRCKIGVLQKESSSIDFWSLTLLIE